MMSLGGSGIVWTHATSLVYSVVLGEGVGEGFLKKIGGFSTFSHFWVKLNIIERSLLSPHIPCGIHVESMSFQMDSTHSIWNMFWLVSQPFWSFHSTNFHLESIWNDMESMWIPSFHLESTYYGNFSKKGNI